MKEFLLCLTVCLFQFPVLAQKKNEAYQLHINRASSPIKIDGVLDEKAWQEADVATDFFMVLPMDTSRAKVRTTVLPPGDPGLLRSSGELSGSLRPISRDR